MELWVFGWINYHVFRLFCRSWPTFHRIYDSVCHFIDVLSTRSSEYSFCSLFSILRWELLVVLALFGLFSRVLTIWSHQTMDVFSGFRMNRYVFEEGCDLEVVRWVFWLFCHEEIMGILVRFAWFIRIFHMHFMMHHQKVKLHTKISKDRLQVTKDRPCCCILYLWRYREPYSEEFR